MDELGWRKPSMSSGVVTETKSSEMWGEYQQSQECPQQVSIERHEKPNGWDYVKAKQYATLPIFWVIL